MDVRNVTGRIIPIVIPMVLLLAQFWIQPVAAEPDGPDVYRAANFTITYRGPGNEGTCDTRSAADGGDGPLFEWPQEAKTSLNYAIDILDDLITSSQTIVVDACYQNHSQETSLAYAGAVDSYAIDYGLGTLNYAVALANARDNLDNNGASAEITASVNRSVAWDYCTTGCVVDQARSDFVSTMLHELLHGLGFSMSFGVDNVDNPTTGNYSDPPGVTDAFVYTSQSYVADPGRQLTTVANNSTQLLDIFQAGSGFVEFRGPQTVAFNGFAPYVYSVQNGWEEGSSMSHLDDNHPTNLGRMMNAATDDGPSSRTVDGITLMFLKDIGWTVNDDSDYGDPEMTGGYGQARHINDTDFANHLFLGTGFTTETPSRSALVDDGDDGVSRANEPWQDGVDGGSVAITVGGTAGVRGCVSGWIDWDKNNSFAEAGEQIVAMQPVTNGGTTLSFTVPAGTFPADNQPFNARFRLVPDWDRDGACDDQVLLRTNLGVFGGEVEDYQWSFGTVTLDNFIYLPAMRRGTVALR